MHEPRPAQVPNYLRTNARVSILDGDRNDVDLRFEREAVIEPDREALGDYAANRFRGVVDAPEEVDVASRSGDRRIPHAQHDGALDHKAL